MKNRFGFVSNSSSSSFVVIGVNRDFSDEEKRRALAIYDYDDKKIEEEFDGNLRDAFYEVMNSTEYSYGTEPFYFGVSIAKSYDESLDPFEMDFEEIHNIAKTFSEKFGISIHEVKLFGGTEAC